MVLLSRYYSHGAVNMELLIWSYYHGNIPMALLPWKHAWLCIQLHTV